MTKYPCRVTFELQTTLFDQFLEYCNMRKIKLEAAARVAIGEYLGRRRTAGNSATYTYRQCRVPLNEEQHKRIDSVRKELEFRNKAETIRFLINKGIKALEKEGAI